MAGILGALGYMRELANVANKTSLADAMDSIRNYERSLSEHFLAGVARIPRIGLYGISDPLRAMQRTPTFALRVEGIPPDLVAQKLSKIGIFVWDGDFYAVDLMKRLGLDKSGGVVRVGFVHYNTAEEADRVLEALEEM
jgi:selenocysteine lyase/cysteine desulfurase